MYKTAVQLYFWPGMKNTIKQAVDSCAITHCRQIKEDSQIMHTFAGLQQQEYTQLIEATLQGK